MRKPRRDRSAEVIRRRTVDAVERITPWSARRVTRGFFGWLEEVRQLASGTVHQHVTTVARRVLPDLLGRETACVATIRRLGPADIERCLERRRRSRGPAARRALDCSVVRFLEYCVYRGWLGPAVLSDLRLTVPYWTREAPRIRTERAIDRVHSSAARRALRDYARWLEEDRQLALSSIELRLRTARKLFTYWLGSESRCVGRLRCLTVGDVEGAFLRRRRETSDPSSQRTFQAGLRSFLRFCAVRGWVSTDLAEAVPSIRCYRLSTVPRGVADTDLPKLFRALGPPSSFEAKRDRAVLLLLATYGVRRAQVAGLQLRDLDWKKRHVFFRAHKGGRGVRHQLTPAVAESLADYLQARPLGCSDPHVFLRIAPRKQVGLSPAMVSVIVTRLFETAEIESHPKGPHALRHAFAKRILAAEKPLKTVSDLLGHRSLDSTAVYAKVDVGRLRLAPLDWPEVLQ